MLCKCAILIKENKKYLVKCDYCKTNPITFYQSKYKWYEYPVILIRDNPELRLIIGLYCLFGYAVIFILLWLDWVKIFLIKKYKFVENIFAIFAIFYVGIIFGYLSIIQKLDHDIHYRLEKPDDFD